MSYRDFSFPEVIKRVSLEVDERVDLFNGLEPAPVSSWLREALTEMLPLAAAINTEKARSEMLIVPVLIEARKLLNRDVSLFSGVDFSVDPEQGLNGFCDYIFSRSREQFYLKAPALLVAEAKNEDMKGGLGQCLAAMVAAQIFNTREKSDGGVVFGAISTGEIWRFLLLAGQTVRVDFTGYSISDVGKILGILRAMLDGTASRLK